MDAAKVEVLEDVAPRVAAGAGGKLQSEARPGLRTVALWVHRYVGLFMTVFLVVAGLTGSVLAFYHELEVALLPGLYRAPATDPASKPLDPFELREALQRQLPAGLRANSVLLNTPAGETEPVFVSTAPGTDYAGDDEFFIDPYTGRMLGSRRWGDISQGLSNLLPFLYRLHYSLALGEVGSYLFGVVGLLWTLDCFVGGYLTFPVSPRREGRRGVATWLARWMPAWLLRGGQLFSWIFTWHRASGLWVWAVLLVFAWSAVGLNLHEVYEPVMRVGVGMKPYASDRLPRLDPPRLDPGLDFREARRRGQALMAEEARRRGFEVEYERRLAYNPELGAFRYQVRSSLDVSDRYVSTTVWLDGQSGELLAFEAPTGQNAGRTLTTWLYLLHFASVRGLGLSYRVFVCVLGVAIAALSVTGVWVWWVKRAKRVRQLGKRRRAELAASSAAN